jgi:hypothetical protein
MRYLLDTHTLIWLFENNPQLSDRVKLIIVNESNELFISIASLWEMTIKSSLGKLDLQFATFRAVRSKADSQRHPNSANPVATPSHSSGTPFSSPRSLRQNYHRPSDHRKFHTPEYRSGVRELSSIL